MSRKKVTEPKVLEVYEDADQAQLALGTGMDLTGWGEKSPEVESRPKDRGFAGAVRDYIQSTVIKEISVATLTNYRYDLTSPARLWENGAEQFRDAIADVLPDFKLGKMHIVRFAEQGDNVHVRIALGK